MIVYGAGLSDGNRHTHEDLPTLIAGTRRQLLQDRAGALLPQRNADVQSVPDDDGSHGRAAWITSAIPRAGWKVWIWPSGWGRFHSSTFTLNMSS